MIPLYLGLSWASTFPKCASKKDVDGRNKSGHDEDKPVVTSYAADRTCWLPASANLSSALSLEEPVPLIAALWVNSI